VQGVAALVEVRRRGTVCDSAGGVVAEQNLRGLRTRLMVRSRVRLVR
jgi:hypothetical protein